MGLDVAEAAARAATATSEVPVLQGDLSMPRPAGVLPFDVVTMWDVLEHLWDPVGDLRRARSWLASRGLIVIQTQNANGVTYGWMRHRWEQFVDGHLYHFSSRTLLRALELAGFEEIRIEASDRFVPGDPAALKDPAAPRACFRDGLLGLLRQLRDSLYVRRGFDPFNIMVATARCPAGG
jgi:hypothetical protein